jgi:Tol biopolymer transport system component
MVLGQAEIFMRNLFRVILLCVGYLMLLMVAPLGAQDETQYISYLAGQNYAGELYLLNTATGESAPIETNVERVTDYDWSPDGEQIAFSDGYSIYTMNADGTNQQELRHGAQSLTETHYTAPVWSPDGSRLAFIEYGSRGVVKIIDPSDAEHSINIVAPVINPPIIWSPDSNSMAFYQIGAPDPIFTVVSDLSDCSPSAGECTYSAYDFSGYISRWSPDSQQLAISSGKPCCKLILRNIDLSIPGCANSYKRDCAIASNPGNIHTNGSTPPDAVLVLESPKGWSSDGQSILLISNPSGTSQIYVMDTNDGSLHQLTSSPTSKSAAQWSPDEKQIVFVDYEIHNMPHGSISLMNSDGSDIRILTEIDTTVGNIQWRPS